MVYHYTHIGSRLQHLNGDELEYIECGNLEAQSAYNEMKQELMSRNEMRFGNQGPITILSTQL